MTSITDMQLCACALIVVSDGKKEEKISTKKHLLLVLLAVLVLSSSASMAFSQADEEDCFAEPDILTTAASADVCTSLGWMACCTRLPLKATK